MDFVDWNLANNICFDKIYCCVQNEIQSASYLMKVKEKKEKNQQFHCNFMWIVSFDMTEGDMGGKLP